MADHALKYAEGQIEVPLAKRIQRHFDIFLFEAHARLDVSTFGASSTKDMLDTAYQFCLADNYGLPFGAWAVLGRLVQILRMVTSLVMQLVILVRLLKGYGDVAILGTLGLLPPLLNWLHSLKTKQPPSECIMHNAFLTSTTTSLTRTTKLAIVLQYG